MQEKNLLKYFKELPVQEQNKILVDAYAQIAALHDAGKSYDSFDWNDCTLNNGILTINAAKDDYLNDEAFLRNILDYAKVIYCLATGNETAESMNWDAGRKIQSNVLREIVLTICGRNYSVEPLLEKLRQPYVDEDTFFNNYTTVDEKEGHEAAEKQRRIDEQNRAQHKRDRNQAYSAPSPYQKPWGERIAIFIILALCFGGYKAYKYNKEYQSRQAAQQIEQMYEQRRQMHETLRNVKVDLPFRAKHVKSDSATTAEE